MPYRTFRCPKCGRERERAANARFCNTGGCRGRLEPAVPQRRDYQQVTLVLADGRRCVYAGPAAWEAVFALHKALAAVTGGGGA